MLNNDDYAMRLLMSDAVRLRTLPFNIIRRTTLHLIYQDI